ncbi:MAG: DNA topoisomerase I [archaeon]|nr:DNA topoisomerase I [archaeon]
MVEIESEEEEPEEEQTRVSSKKKQWATLSHNGVVFPESYKSDPRTNTISIKGEKIVMNLAQEEMAVAWAKKIGTPYVEDPVFQKNFLSDFLKLFPEKYRNAKISDIIFPTLPEKAELTKEQKKTLAAERKKKRLELKEKFGYALVDGVKTEIANWVVEPPGIYMGRGQIPIRGHWKPRILEEDVTLNLDKNAQVPKGKWKIVHEPHNMWVACWTDKLTGKVKYIWLHDSSSLRQMRDKSKYDKAQRLEKDIRKVDSFILKAMKSKDPKERKIATACFLIHRLAMRVGDEKDEDEADTVGASTLRVEHLIFPRPNTVDFDFFGKDYVRWQKTLEVSPSEGIAIENLKEFCKGKQPEDLIFDGITSRHVNEFFGKASQGLTAKVFRTYIATSVVKDYLKEHSAFPDGTPEHDKIYEARLANLEAALKCNHKRTPPKTFEQTLQKKKDRLAQLEQSIPKTDRQKEKLKLRIAKLKKQIELSEQTKDYNLNTSLRNYIDPRVFKSWADRIKLDWKVLYTATLQRKMAWVDGEAARVQAPQPAEVTVKVEKRQF